MQPKTEILFINLLGPATEQVIYLFHVPVFILFLLGSLNDTTLMMNILVILYSIGTKLKHCVHFYHEQHFASYMELPSIMKNRCSFSE